MADTDGTLDHRAELMRKWSADKTLMAQAGLLQAEDLLGHMHLGPPKTVAKRTEKLAEDHAPPAHISKKKKHIVKKPVIIKGMKPQEKQTLKQLLLEEATHHQTDTHNNKKNKTKTNPHINSKETVDELDAKVTEHIEKYRDQLNDALEHIKTHIDELPSNKTTYLLNTLKTVISNNIKDVKDYIKGSKAFGETFISIANGLYSTVTISMMGVKYAHKFTYPPFYNFNQDKTKLMRKGYFVHEILTMTCFYLMRNMKDEKMTEHKEKIQGVVHDLMKFKRETDKTYSQLIKLKRALDIKVKLEKKADTSISHRHLQNLRDDAEDIFNHEREGGFKMGQPFEEY
jgi:hypothetical protein